MRNDPAETDKDTGRKKKDDKEQSGAAMKKGSGYAKDTMKDAVDDVTEDKVKDTIEDAIDKIG